MKTFRIIYRFNSISTERYIRARNEDEARAKFGETVGDPDRIIQIEAVDG